MFRATITYPARSSLQNGGVNSTHPFERSVLRGLAVLRWASWIWSTGVLIYSWQVSGTIDRPEIAIAVLTVGFVLAVIATKAAAADPDRALRAPLILADVGMAVALFLADGLAFSPNHVFQPGQSLVASWPLFAVAVLGVAFGPRIGALGGLVMGASRLCSAYLNGPFEFTNTSKASLANTFVFTSLSGAVAGWIMMQLRRAENEVASLRAREDFARTMHDSVLQTLTLVERRTRSTDPILANLAKDTDRELRSYLYGASDSTEKDLTTSVREVVDRVSSRYAIRIESSVIEGEVAPSAEVVRAITSAMNEALVNCAKHAEAKRVVVFVDGDDEGKLFASVRDDGAGFDVALVRAASTVGQDSRQGVRESIVGRMESIGGRVEIESSPGKGTEVRLWGP